MNLKVTRQCRAYTSGQTRLINRHFCQYAVNFLEGLEISDNLCIHIEGKALSYVRPQVTDVRKIREKLVSYGLGGMQTKKSGKTFNKFSG